MGKNPSCNCDHEVIVEMFLKRNLFCTIQTCADLLTEIVYMYVILEFTRSECHRIHCVHINHLNILALPFYDCSGFRKRGHKAKEEHPAINGRTKKWGKFICS